MATVNKDFKIKSGLIVEGTTGTINNFDILTKKQDDQDYIVSLIGGTATSVNTPDTVVKRDANGDFAAGAITADLTGDVTGNADTATALETARTIELTGDVTGSVSFDGSANVSITATVDGSFATDSEVATAKSEAIADAATYTDGRETAITTAYQSYADTAEADAISTANAYTDGRETAITTAYQSYADTAEADAISAAALDATTKANAAQAAAEATASADATAKANAAQAAAELHADTAIANLVDSAPATLDTLNELAAALQDNPDIISDLQDIAAGKQDTLTAGANIDITGATISVTGLDTDDVAEGTNLYFTNQRALDATASAYDPAGSAATAQSNAESFATTAANNAETNAESYADGLAVNYDAAGSAAAAEAAANTYTDNSINALDTDDIEEGLSNLYFTDTRAKDSAGDLLAGATTENVVVTYTGGVLSITAENGVADSTTSDLAEGSNLYFTDARAVDALEAVVPNFTAVELNSVAKQVAATLEAATAGIQVAHSFAKADYRSAEYLVKVAYGDHTEISKVLLTLDVNDNIAITEYGIVGTNGSASTISAGISGTDVQLQVTTSNNNSTVTVMGTLLV